MHPLIRCEFIHVIDLAGMKMSRILNGMWQVSGAHGYDPNKEKAVAEMAHYADEGAIYTYCIYICTFISNHTYMFSYM